VLLRARGLLALLPCVTFACGAKTGLHVPDPCEAATYCFEAPYRGPPNPERVVIVVASTINQVDVAIVMDTTGSMGAAIENLKTNLTSSLIPSMIASIPGVAIALVDHRDFPVFPFGTTTDWPVKILQTVTTDIELARTAVGKYSIAGNGGFDGPEAQIPAMHHTLTGDALSWPSGSVAKHVPRAGTTGGVDFRPGALPVIVEITDVTWHDESNVPYTFPAPRMTDLVAAFSSAHARFVDITNQGASEDQANSLSDVTNSSISPEGFRGKCGAGQCCTGVLGAPRPTTADGRCRLNFLHSSGTGVSDSLITAIDAISVGTVFDMTAIAHNDPTNPGGVDTTKMIKAVRAMDEGDASKGCLPRAAKDTDGDGIRDTFPAVVVGTRVCFELVLRKNDYVPATDVPQYFRAFVDIVGMPGAVLLERETAVIVIPPKA